MDKTQKKMYKKIPIQCKYNVPRVFQSDTRTCLAFPIILAKGREYGNKRPYTKKMASYNHQGYEVRGNEYPEQEKYRRLRHGGEVFWDWMDDSIRDIVGKGETKKYF